MRQRYRRPFYGHGNNNKRHYNNYYNNDYNNNNFNEQSKADAGIDPYERELQKKLDENKVREVEIGDEVAPQDRSDDKKPEGEVNYDPEENKEEEDAKEDAIYEEDEKEEDEKDDNDEDDRPDMVSSDNDDTQIAELKKNLQRTQYQQTIKLKVTAKDGKIIKIKKVPVKNIDPYKTYQEEMRAEKQRRKQEIFEQKRAKKEEINTDLKKKKQESLPPYIDNILPMAIPKFRFNHTLPLPKGDDINASIKLPKEEKKKQDNDGNKGNGNNNNNNPPQEPRPVQNPPQQNNVRHEHNFYDNQFEAELENSTTNMNNTHNKNGKRNQLLANKTSFPRSQLLRRTQLPVTAPAKENPIYQQLGNTTQTLEQFRAVSKTKYSPLDHNRFRALTQYMDLEVIKEVVDFYDEKDDDGAMHYAINRQVIIEDDDLFTQAGFNTEMRGVSDPINRAKTTTFYYNQSLESHVAFAPENAIYRLGNIAKHVSTLQKKAAQHTDTTRPLAIGYIINPIFKKGTYAIGDEKYAYEVVRKPRQANEALDRELEGIINRPTDTQTLVIRSFNKTEFIPYIPMHNNVFAIQGPNNSTIFIHALRSIEIDDITLKECAIYVTTTPQDWIPPEYDYACEKVKAFIGEFGREKATLVGPLNVVAAQPALYPTFFNFSKFKLEEKPVTEGENVKIQENAKHDVILISVRTGRIFDDNDKIRMPMIQLNDNVKTIPAKIVNKTIATLTTAPEINKKVLLEAMSYINRNMPDADINDTVLPTVAYCIRKTIHAESFIKLLQNTREYEVLCKLKKDEYDLQPSNWKEAWRKKKLFSYIVQRIRSMCGFEVETNALDFDKLTKNF